ncbi:MAG TPA: hypothetical protein VFK69_06925 [Candidatus Eisenbacteria bacterium]|nr:hypothetical protein [Candidatus Eisenbacteria bacterium]
MTARVPAIATLAAMGALALATARAQAGAAPDSGRLTLLRAACASGGLIAVQSDGHERLTRRPRVDGDGVAIPLSHGRPALVTVGAIAPAERRIPWAKVDRIDALRTHAALGFAAGALIGGAIMAATLSATGPDLAESGDGGMVFLGVTFTAMTAGAGAMLGATHPHRQPLYP